LGQEAEQVLGTDIARRIISTPSKSNVCNRTHLFTSRCSTMIRSTFRTYQHRCIVSLTSAQVQYSATSAHLAFLLFLADLRTGSGGLLRHRPFFIYTAYINGLKDLITMKGFS
jgi:hypothetical protein